MAWYNVHRPGILDHVLGQDGVVKMLSSKLKDKSLPHFVLFAGPTGTGKTTVARILKYELECGDSDFVEKNGATERGIETVREMKEYIPLRAMGGKVRIWLIDEAHQQTPEAQKGMLKITEDIPPHVYIFFASSEPDKLQKALRDRAFRVDFNPLSDSDLREIMRSVGAAESVKVSNAVRDEIIAECDGSARLALMMMEQACSLDTDEERLSSIQKASPKRQSIELCKAILANRSWKTVATMLQGMETEPEKARRHVLAYMTAVLLSGGPKAVLAAKAIRCFQYNYFDTGKAGLALSCWEFFES